MRTILFSLTTLFAISITGCLDDAQQPEPQVLAAEGQALRNDIPDQPVAIQDEIDDGAAVLAPIDESDPLFCKTVADCEPGYGCRLDLHKCMLNTH